MSDQTFRILVIDDNTSIHEDFRKVLAPGPPENRELSDLEAMLFGRAVPLAEDGDDEPQFEVDAALQGESAVQKVRDALAEGRPYAAAFVDMRMPPGWDGVRTVREMRQVEPTLQVAICTAYSDYSPTQIAGELRPTGPTLIVPKPFENADIRELAATLCGKWQAQQQCAA